MLVANKWYHSGTKISQAAWANPYHIDAMTIIRGEVLWIILVTTEFSFNIAIILTQRAVPDSVQERQS